MLPPRKMTEDFAVAASGTRKRFGAIEALRGIDITVRVGEIYGLLGPNGSGKTTFIRCVAGLLRPDGGTLTVLGGAPRAAVAAGQVGYMTQAPALYGDLSVAENLRFFAALQGVDHADGRPSEPFPTTDSRTLVTASTREAAALGDTARRARRG